MNTDKNNTQLPQTDVKSRFFAQYWGQNVCQTKGGKYKVDEDCFPLWKRSYLELKHISKITDKDTEHIMQLEGFIDGFLSDDFLNFLNDLKKGHCNKFEVIDYLRTKGYALPFMEYSIDDLISFGWVQFV